MSVFFISSKTKIIYQLNTRIHMSTYFKDFDDYMIIKNFAQATREAYGCGLKQFFQYHKDNNWDLPYTDKQAKTYILHRYKQGKKWQTINGDYSAIRKFFIKVRDLEWDIYNLPRPRKESKLPEIISQQEVVKLIESNFSRNTHVQKVEKGGKVARKIKKAQSSIQRDK